MTSYAGDLQTVSIKSLKSVQFRSSRPEVSYRKVVIKKFLKTTGKHLLWSLLFNKVAYLRSATLLKKRRVFQLVFQHFEENLFIENTFSGCGCQFEKQLPTKNWFWILNQLLTFHCFHFGKNNRSFHVQLNTRISCIPY